VTSWLAVGQRWIVAFGLGAPAPELVPPPPREPTPVLELRWDAPASCPSADEVRAKIVELMQRPLGEEPTHRIVVDATVTAGAAGFEVTLAVQTDAGASTRRFTAERCAELLMPSAVVVAIAIDPHVEGDVGVASPEPIAPRQPPVVAATVEPVPEPIANAEPEPAVDRAAPASTPRPRRELRALLAARAGLDAGNLPGVGAAIEASAGVRLRRARVELGATHLFERTESRPESGGGALRLTAARGRGCWEPRRRQLSFPLCGGAELGIVRARGVALQQAATVRRVWFAVLAQGGLVWSPRPRVGLSLAAELVVSPARHAFEIAGEALYTTGIAGVRATAGVEVRLP
jgi:hypothetical protein